MTPSSPQQIQSELHRALGALPLGGECVLLDWPDYPNAGDHLIWLGAALYLERIRGVRLRYVASLRTFSERALEAASPGVPIILSGGGNFGDLWPEHQRFREQIVLKHPDRPIIVLPQTIHFEDPENLRRATRVFNAHPNLTVCVRCRRSRQIAEEHFANCRIVLAPDMSFELAGVLKLPYPPELTGRPLYHCRTDKEQPPGVSPDWLGLDDFEMDDWVTCRRSWKGIYWQTPGPYRLRNTLRRYLREKTIAPLERLRELRSALAWRKLLPLAGRHPFHARSWALAHAGAYQMSRYGLVATNRLHGHILCVLLGIPHVFLPGAYHKNEAFYETWTSRLPGVEFVPRPDAASLKAARERLLAAVTPL